MTCLILSLILSPFRVLSPFRSAIPFRVLSPFRSAFPFRVLSPFRSAFYPHSVPLFRSAFYPNSVPLFRSAFYPHSVPRFIPIPFRFSVPLFRSVPPFRHSGSAFYPNPCESGESIQKSNSNFCESTSQIWQKSSIYYLLATLIIYYRHSYRENTSMIKDITCLDVYLLHNFMLSGKQFTVANIERLYLSEVFD